MINLIDPDPTLKLGVFKNNQDGTEVNKLDTLKEFKLTTLLRNEGKGVYILVNCREYTSESHKNKDLFYTIIKNRILVPETELYQAIDNFLKDDAPDSFDKFNKFFKSTRQIDIHLLLEREKFIKLIVQAKTEHITISDLRQFLEKELNPESIHLARQNSSTKDVIRNLDSNPALLTSLMNQPYTWSMWSEESMSPLNLQKISSFLPVILRSPGMHLHKNINDFLHSDDVSEITLIEQIQHNLTLLKSMSKLDFPEIHVLIDFLKKAKANHISTMFNLSIYANNQLRLIHDIKDVQSEKRAQEEQESQFVQEVDGGKRKTKRIKHLTKLKKHKKYKTKRKL